MTILNYIDPFWFLISLGIGLMYTCITSAPPEIVIKYPTPYNANAITYTDMAGVCYKYQVIPVATPQDTSKIRKMPLQINPYIEPPPAPPAPSWKDQLLAAIKIK
jgi:hypothetical protein